MDTKQVVARFEAARQALAMMDHPNIAKVLDAGTTDVGRPCFVMEVESGREGDERRSTTIIIPCRGEPVVVDRIGSTALRRREQP